MYPGSTKKAERNELTNSIPKDWRLSPEILDNLPLDVRKIPKECGILTEEELAITDIDEPEVLLRKLAASDLSAVQVTTAFLKRAAIAHQLVNCLTAFYYEEALAEARRLDDELEKTGKPRPLHGLPISIKDQFDIEGRELTMGYASWLGRISPRNSALVDCLLAAGAVLYVRTNVPQTLLHGETANAVFGLTVNPYNSKLTPGGSSGGEGALLALKGSPLGVGTDVGGSVRIPAGFCGLYALRPCTSRIPYGRASNSFLGQINILSAIGPMCRSVSGCTTFFKSVIDQQPHNYDATAIPLPFRSDLYESALRRKSLCFGLATWDEHIMPWPPIGRALKMTEEALVKAGHKVISFPLSDFKRIAQLNYELFFADAAHDIKETFAETGETLYPVTGVDIPEQPLSVYQVYQLNREKEHYQQLFLEKWRATSQQTETGREIDGLLFPLGPTTACVHSNMDYDNYTSFWNLLDLPAFAFPVDKVEKSDVYPSNFSPISEADALNQQRYDPDLMQGTPVGLQVIGRRWQEESLLGAAQRIDDALKAAKK